MSYFKQLMSIKTISVRGFTLLELLFVVAIMGVLISVSLPQFKKNFNVAQLNSFSKDLQGLMNYAHERAVVDGKIYFLNVDNDKREYWIIAKADTLRLKTYRVPEGISLEPDKNEILFYPDGNIDQVDIKVFDRDRRSVTLTTKGIYGGVKLQLEK